MKKNNIRKPPRQRKKTKNEAARRALAKTQKASPVSRTVPAIDPIGVGVGVAAFAAILARREARKA